MSLGAVLDCHMAGPLRAFATASCRLSAPTCVMVAPGRRWASRSTAAPARRAVPRESSSTVSEPVAGKVETAVATHRASS